MSGLELSPLSRPEAERLTEGIRTALDRTARGMADLAARVSEAYQRRADLALGYESWSEYAETEFGEQTQLLAAPIRRELVSYLSAEGMSSRSIAPAMGITDRRARQIVNEVGSDFPPESEAVAVIESGAAWVEPGDEIPLETRTHIDRRSGQVIDREPIEPEPAPVRKVTGLDGKTYTPPPAQPKPIRPQLPGHYAGAIVELDKAINRLERLHADDRFNTNKKNVALTHESDIQRAITRLNHLKDELN